MIASKPKDYFPALTGIRAVVGYMIYVHHFNPFNTSGWQNWCHSLVNEFHIAINIFFVLSGFLIALWYYDMKVFEWRGYIIRRIARVYPIYFVLTSLTFFFGTRYLLDVECSDAISYVLNITFIKGFSNELVMSGILQAWSLTVEETFYFLAPFLFFVVRKTRYALLGLPILLLLLGLIMVRFFKPHEFYGFFTSHEYLLSYTFFGRSFEFFVGIGLALFYRSTRFPQSAKGYTYFGLVVLLLSIWILTTLKGSFDFGVRPWQGKLISYALLPLFGIVPLFIGLIRERTMVSRMLSSPLAIILGRSSYAFYLIHMGFFQVWISRLSDVYLCKFLMLNLIAIGIYFLVEHPLNQLIKEKFGSTS